MNTRLLSIISTGMAVFFAVLLFTRSCDPPTTPPDDPEKRELLDRVAELEEDIQLTKDSLRQNEALQEAQRVRYTSDTLSLNRENRRLCVRYNEAKAQVQQLSDTSGRIAAYVHVSDSLLAVKDSTIAVERNNAMVAGKLWQMEVGLIGEKYIKQVEISNEYKARAESLEKKTARLEKRLERKRKGNRILLGVAGGLAAVTTLLIIAE